MRRQQRGMAIIMALLVVALAATAASTVLWQQSLWWRQVDNDQLRAGMRQVSSAAEDWAAEILRADLLASGERDYLAEDWAQPLPTSFSGDFRVDGQLSDAQGRFNIRNLLQPDGKPDEAAVKLYQGLLRVLGQDEKLVEPLLDWLDADEEARPHGAEAGWYAAQQPPRKLASNEYLRRAEQLRWLRGYDAAVMRALLPHIVVLPQRSVLNVNTATRELLQALVPGLPASQAEALLLQRRSIYFKDAADFGARLTGGLQPLPVEIGVRSDFFLFDCRIRHERSQLQLRALYRRDAAATRQLWRQEGIVPGVLPGKEKP